jgi:glucose/mannose-6-phosphate isomerase
LTINTTSSLDDAAALARRDPGGMLHHIADFPNQMRVGWATTRKLSLPEAYRAAPSVAVLGMGGSAICGDLVRSIFADRLRVPVITLRDYDLPAWVDDKTFVAAVSHSGTTEETISSVSAALSRKANVAVITTGGALGEVAARVQLPLLKYPDQTPPRAALGYTLPILTGVLERARMLDVADGEIDGAVAALEVVIRNCGPDQPTESNPAKQLAWSLLDRLPVVEAAGFLAPVAYRWKTQLNENSKSFGAVETLPEATHNAVVGYDNPDVLHDHMYVVFLASSADHPRNSLRATLSSELLTSVGVAYQVVPVGGEGRLAQACAAILLGDYVSTYLALLYGVDPMPVDAISHVKRRLSGPESAREPEDGED